MNTLTQKQKKILDYISQYIKKQGYAPTLKELKKYFKLSSFATIHQHIATLEEKGYLKKEDHHPRAIEISKPNKKNIFIDVPMVGTITAGEPIEAIEDRSGVITLTQNELGGIGNFYALKVSGNSMIDEGIFDGDIVIIKEQKTALNGETVVAIIDDNSATLKKIYKEKNRFRLQPANQTLLPLYRTEVEIKGIVIKIIRNLKDNFLIPFSTTTEINDFAKKKKTFLESIKSHNDNSQNIYKRVVVSPLRYAGGKSLAVGFIVELLPDTIKKIISPFFGGGSIEIACNKFLGLEIIGFDIFDILVNYWQTQISNPDGLYKKLARLTPDEKTYKMVKEKLKDHWQGNKKLSPLDLATYYYFNHNLSYGPGFLGWPSKIYLNQKKYQSTLEKVKSFSANNLKIECSDFETAFEKYPNDFFYCDPPYLLGKDTKMFKGIYPMRNIPIHHNGFKHEKLRDLLKKHKGGFVLSYNNCETIRNWYSEFSQHFPKWQYTMGQGETRIGVNRKNEHLNHVKESHEIIIFSPPKI